jgi:hypothetical protein
MNKYLIVHFGDSAWHLSRIDMVESSLSGKISTLPDNHLKYKTTQADSSNRYIKKLNESCVLEEVHLYVKDSLFSDLNSNDSIKISISAIIKAEVYKKAKGRTIVSWLVPGLGIPILAVGIIALIAGLSMSGGVAVL